MPDYLPIADRHYPPPSQEEVTDQLATDLAAQSTQDRSDRILCAILPVLVKASLCRGSWERHDWVADEAKSFLSKLVEKFP